jgi:hypothetical protein
MAMTVIMDESVGGRWRGHDMECEECGGHFHARCFRCGRGIGSEVEQCFESYNSPVMLATSKAARERV